MRILIVDDRPDNRRLLSLIISSLGHSAEEASSGADAVQRCGGDPFDLVFMDLDMPGMDGFEAARQIRAASTRAIRIIALSGFAGEEAAARSAQAGMDGYIAKPFKIETIGATIASVSSGAPAAGRVPGGHGCDERR